MEEKKLSHPPEQPKLETAIAIAKGIIGLLPAGGVFVELVNKINPIEKRKQAWLGQLTDATNEIYDRFKILPEELWTDERFVSFSWEASLIAIKNHRKEKIFFLQQAIISTASISSIQEDEAFQFLRYIDELTVTHLKIISCLNANPDKFLSLKKLEEILSLIEILLDEKFERVSFRSFLTDLERMYLIRIEDIEELPEHGPKGPDVLTAGGGGFSGIIVLPHGKNFLRFINKTGSAH